MTTEVKNQFTSFILTEREQAECLILNDLQRKGIMNARTEIAMRLINLDFDVINPHDFGIQQSFLRGQLSAYQYLLDAEDEARKAALEIAIRDAKSQNQS